MEVFIRQVGAQLRKPSGGFWQFLVRRMVLDSNGALAKSTIDVLQLKPDENVLEIGFGFGPGITYALDSYIRNASGTLYGVDYSESSCDYVTKLLPKDIESGKLKIFHGDVTKMPLEDSSIDKIYHNNCFYYWPDIDAAAKEINRVMKPGGLVIAGQNPKKVDFGAKGRFVNGPMCQPERYTTALKKAGFIDVKEEFTSSDLMKVNYILMFGTKAEA